MTRFELHSYIEKFAQLSSLGLNANLHFDSYNRKIYASLQAELGNVRPANSQYERQSTRSRTRRRKRREAAAARTHQIQAVTNNLHENSERQICDQDAPIDVGMVEFEDEHNMSMPTTFGTPNSTVSIHSLDTSYPSFSSEHFSPMNFDQTTTVNKPPADSHLDVSAPQVEQISDSGINYSRNQTKPAIRVISEEELNAELRSLGMMTTHELEAKYGDG